MLHAEVGGTPLVELTRLDLANGNRLFAKLEYKNPGGSHYDRVYVTLLKRLEDTGKIVPGLTHLVETTTGSAGASFAWVAAQLGYQCTVIIPDDVSVVRKRQILDRGAELVTSPAGRYVHGAVETLHRYLVKRKADYRAGRLYCVNHSRDPASVQAVATIADEVHAALSQQNCKVDHFVLGCGNGTTILGIGGHMKQLRAVARCVAFDPFEAPVAYERKFPGRYEREFGTPPEFRQHRILGTGGWGMDFPNISNPQFLSIVDDVRLVRDEEMITAQALLAEREGKFPGRSSAAAVAVARRLAREVENQVIVVIFYDELKYYSGTSPSSNRKARNHS